MRIRLRLRDGRKVSLYYKSDITAGLRELEKLTAEGTPRPRVTVYNKTLVERIKRTREAMREAYIEMTERGMDIKAEVFADLVDEILHPRRRKADPDRVFMERFGRFIVEGERDGLFGENRRRQYEVVRREAGRFLAIYHIEDIKVDGWTPELLMDFRQFLFDEYTFVNKHPVVYMDIRDTPKERRSSNTVATKMKKLKSFFTELESKGEIGKSPFRALGAKRVASVTREEYDDPVSLSLDLFRTILNKDVPDRLEETRDAFVLQCALGCRIGDFRSLTMENVDVRDGIPFVHYLPRKTINTQSGNTEVETPLVRFAYRLVGRYRMGFAILRNISGKDGYNVRIRELFRYCGIDERVSVFDEALGDNVYRPMHDVASSKMARKTHVNLMTKAQVNKYASGLHKEGSKAVDRYTKLDLRDRFVLLSAAFDEPLYEADDPAW